LDFYFILFYYFIIFPDNLVKLLIILLNIGCFYYNIFYFGIPLNISYITITFNLLDLNNPIDTPRDSRFIFSLLVIEIAPGVPELINP
jgi:hypothetical protein